MNCPTAAGNRPNAGCDGGRTELEPHAIGPHARLRRSEIIEHGRNEFRDGRMNVHRPLQDLVGGLGVRHVENAQASALLESSGLKPTLRRATLSGIADEMSIYEIP